MLIVVDENYDECLVKRKSKRQVQLEEASLSKKKESSCSHFHIKKKIIFGTSILQSFEMVVEREEENK